MSRRKKRRQRVQFVEQRSTSYGPVPLNDSHTLFGNYPMTSTGIRVDNYSASCNIVFRRCTEIIATTLGRLAFSLVRDGNLLAKCVESDLITKQANDYTTAYNLKTLLESWAVGWGNGYAWILRSNDMTPVGLYPLHPSRVIPRLVRNTDPKDPSPWGLIYQIDGGREIFLPYEILHIKGNPGFDGVTGYNLVQLHENTLAIAQSQNEYTGEFFQNGAVAGGLVELPAHMKPDTVLKYKQDFQNQYSSRGNRHKLAVVDSGVKFTANTISPEASQLLEARRFSIYEVALICGVPPTMLGDLSHGTYGNVEQQALGFSAVTMHPLAENWRQELDAKLRPDEDCSWRYDLKTLDAADTATRMNYLHTAVGGPWMSKEEAREEDGLPEEIKGEVYPPPNMTDKGDAKGGEKGGDAGGKDDKGDQSRKKIPDDKPADDATEGRAAAVSTEVERREALKRSEIETRSLKSRQRASGAMLPAFADAAGRLVTKEAKAIGGFTKHLREGHPEIFNRKVEDFYGKHQAHVEETFMPALRGLLTQVHAAAAEEFRSDMEMPGEAAAGYAAKLAARHVTHAKDALAGMLTSEPDATKAADAIDARMTDWQEKKAAGEAGYEIRQASNFFARECYRAAGCKQVRWVAHPEDGEECRALDGTKVGIDEPFTKEPVRYHPPRNGECRCNIAGVM